MKRPNLSNEIEQKDVHDKGGGSFKAKYTPWAKTAQILNEKAPDWTFCLETDGGNPVWKAPNGTGFLQCYFRNDDGTATSLFPFAVMDNRNMPKKYETITARDLTDSHRRSLCAASCFFFSLGHHLWSGEEIEENSSPTSIPVKQEQQSNVLPLKSKNQVRLKQEDRKEALAVLKDWIDKNEKYGPELQTRFSRRFLDGCSVGENGFWSTHLLFKDQVEFIYAELEHLQEVVDNE